MKNIVGQIDFRCVRCDQIVMRNANYQLSPTEAELARHKVCRFCVNDMLEEDREMREEPTDHETGRRPLTFWQALSLCWKTRKNTTFYITKEQEMFDQLGDPTTGAWFTLKIITCPINRKHGRVETTIYFGMYKNKTRDGKNWEITRRRIWELLWWDSEHIACLMGKEVIDGPFHGYGSTYHYRGWLGSHHAI